MPRESSLLVTALVGSVLSAMLLSSLSLASVLSFNETSTGYASLALMTGFSCFATGFLMWYLSIWSSRLATRPDRLESFDVNWIGLFLILVVLQPYVNPAWLIYRYWSVFANGGNPDWGYSTDVVRATGTFSGTLVTALYAFLLFRKRTLWHNTKCWYYTKLGFLWLYFVCRIGFTLGAEMDFGSVPMVSICTLIRFESRPAPVSRVVGIVVITVLDIIMWIVAARETRENRKFQTIYGETNNVRLEELLWTHITYTVWTVSIVFSGIVVVATPSSRLQSDDLAFTGVSRNLIGTMAALLLIIWTTTSALLLRTSNDQGSTALPPGYSSGDDRVRVRMFSLEKDIPDWATLVHNSRRSLAFQTPAFSNVGMFGGISNLRSTLLNDLKGTDKKTILPEETDQNTDDEEEGNHFDTLSPPTPVTTIDELLETKEKSALFFPSTITDSLTAFGDAIRTAAGKGEQVLYLKEPTLASKTMICNFCIETACTALNFSFIAYLTGNASNPMSNERVQMFVEDKRYTVFRQISSERKDCHAIVFVSDDTILVTFRGTFSWKNVRTNSTFHVKTHPSSLDWTVSPHPHDRALKKKAITDLPPMAHAGFLKVYQNVRRPLLAAVEELLAEDPTRKVHFCGHSAGGSFASLLAFDVRKTLHVSPAQLFVTSFGSSRLGNTSFRAKYNDAVPQSYSLFLHGDPVTHLPPSFPFGLPIGYKHHGIGILLLLNGSIMCRPTHLELALLHTIEPQDGNRHRLNLYASVLMKALALRNLENVLRPFWNPVIQSLETLPRSILSDAVLLKYLLPMRAKQVTGEISKLSLSRTLSDERRKQMLKIAMEDSLRVKIRDVSIIKPEVFESSGGGQILPVRISLIRLHERIESAYDDEETIMAEKKLGGCCHADWIDRLSEVCYDQTEDQAQIPVPASTVDRDTFVVMVQERMTPLSPTLDPLRSPSLGPLRPPSSGPSHPDNESTFPPTLVLHELKTQTNGDSSVIDDEDNRWFGWGKDGHTFPTLENTTASFFPAADTLRVQFGSIFTDVSISSFYSSLRPDESINMQIPLCLSSSVNPVAFVGLSLRGGSPSIRREFDGFRTWAKAPCYDDSSLRSLSVDVLLPDVGFTLIVKVLEAIDICYPWDLAQCFNQGRMVYCSVNIEREKFSTGLQNMAWADTIKASNDRDDVNGFQTSPMMSSHSVNAKESLEFDSASPRHLKAEFNETFEFGKTRALTGFEEIVIKLKNKQIRSKLLVGKTSTTLGKTTVSLNKLFGRFVRRGELVTREWFPVLGKRATGKVHLEIQLVPKEVGSVGSPGSAPSPRVNQMQVRLYQSQDGGDAGIPTETKLPGSRPIRTFPVRSLLAPSQSLLLSVMGARYLVRIEILAFRHFGTYKSLECSIRMVNLFRAVALAKRDAEKNKFECTAFATATLSKRAMCEFGGSDPINMLHGMEDFIFRLKDSQSGVIVARRSLSLKEILADFAQVDDQIDTAAKRFEDPVATFLAWMVIPWKSKRASAAMFAPPEIKLRFEVFMSEVGGADDGADELLRI